MRELKHLVDGGDWSRQKHSSTSLTVIVKLSVVEAWELEDYKIFRNGF